MKEDYRKLTQFDRIIDMVLESHILNPCDEDYLVTLSYLTQQDSNLNNTLFSLEDEEECDEEEYWEKTAVSPGDPLYDRD